MIRMWLDQGISVEEKDKNGLTPLDICVRKGHVECVQELLLRGAKMDAKHIFFAASKGKEVLLKALLSRGFDGMFRVGIFVECLELI